MNDMKITMELINEMEKAAAGTSLCSLYQRMVDENLFEEGCDYEKSRDLLFGGGEFFFVHPDEKNLYLQQGYAFVASVDANKAVVSDLEELINYLREEAWQNA